MKTTISPWICLILSRLKKFRMEQLGYSELDLAQIIGLKRRASEILNRKLSVKMIRKLHATLDIPTDVLIQAY
jgi:HTH-type transcriptional regulator/antitoxin HigA